MFNSNCSTPGQDASLESAGRARTAREEDRGAARGLSKAHNSPVPTAKFWLGACLVKADRARIMPSSKGGGPRGKISKFSAASRRRLQYLVSQVRKDQPVYFVTLTYPDNFPADPEKWKRDIDAFRKRFARRGWGAIWKIEFKRRKSGENIGKVAPHFHLLVYGADYVKLWHFCGNAWFEIVGSGDPKHKNVGTRVEYVRTVNGARKYIAKYVGKDQEDLDYECKEVGRFWGVINDQVLPWGEEITVEMEDSQVNDLLRLMRRYSRMKRRGNLPSLTVMCNDADFWFDNLHKMVRGGPSE